MSWLRRYSQARSFQWSIFNRRRSSRLTRWRLSSLTLIQFADSACSQRTASCRWLASHFGDDLFIPLVAGVGTVLA